MTIKEKLEEINFPGDVLKISSNLQDLHTDGSTVLLTWTENKTERINTAVLGDLKSPVGINRNILYAITSAFLIMFQNIPEKEFESEEMMYALADMLDDIKEEVIANLNSQNQKECVICNMSKDVPLGKGKKVGSYTQNYINKRTFAIRDEMIKTSESGHETGLISVVKDDAAIAYMIAQKEYDANTDSHTAFSQYRRLVIMTTANTIVACGRENDASDILDEVKYYTMEQINPEFVQTIMDSDEEES